MTTIGDALRELLGLPGARYSCVADPVTGQVLAESGGGATAFSAALLAWGGGAARFLADVDADDLDDLIVTSRRSYHLVRRVGAGPSDRVLVYLCLDRSRGNLAAARRELGSAHLQERLAAGARVGARPALPSGQATSPAAEPDGARLAGPAPSAVDVVPAAPAPPAVPRQRTAMAALPRRSAAPLPPPPPATASAAASAVPLPPGLPRGLTWATDAATLRRLLAALRRMT